MSFQANALVSIAHRGAPQFAPENTIASFKKAIELKADYLETDVQQTSDGELIIMHDLSIDRTTNGKGDVSELSSSEIAKLDAGSWHGDNFKGEKVPTLKSVLELAQLQPKLGFILELKKGNDTYPGIEEKLVKLIRDMGLENRVIMKSFSIPVLKRLRKLMPEAPQIYVFVTSIPSLNLTIDTFLRFHNPLDLEVEYLQSHGTLTGADFIEASHKAGKKVIVWGVEKIDDMRRWKDLKVDAIETDRLDLYNALN